MAKRIIEVLTSDLSNEERSDIQTVKFSLNNQAYSIDLTEEEAEDFELLFQDYISVARKESQAAIRRRQGSPTARGSKSVVEEQTGARPSEVREWAKANGHEVSERGRIHQDVIAAYNAAH
ncbi:histone-like nucleoid-structuring protein Lsr2 [Brevibacterium yomogidense]|uniref:histone-like nucleoid-structuring protein Lsr2 n=1 Tax=Brevibacterium yomogidense TaxID=946573 RepID=UPI0018DF12D6|nr:Lsr2 family protein [Brevibacterium yomogidense]